jgi:hypothetical protein
VDYDNDVNHCTVYADETGSIIETGSYVLEDSRRAAIQDELDLASYNYDGIRLRNGELLVPVKVRRPGVEPEEE